MQCTIVRFEVIMADDSVLNVGIGENCLMVRHLTACFAQVQRWWRVQYRINLFFDVKFIQISITNCFKLVVLRLGKYLEGLQ